MSTIILTSQVHTNEENAHKLLKQLLECVQDCQKRYGGKTELATEFDSCVVGLCLTLEAVLLHGVKSKVQDNSQNSALKQVSDIVTSSLHLGGENPCKLFYYFLIFFCYTGLAFLSILAICKKAFDKA